eukprot:SAG11_NODE_2186_length_3710_cov_1.860426_2_plen_89_part_00
MLAAGRGLAPLVKALLECGAGPDTASREGWTALHFGASQGRTGVCSQLLQLGARPNARNREGQTAVHLACASFTLCFTSPSLQQPIAP